MHAIPQHDKDKGSLNDMDKGSLEKLIQDPYFEYLITKKTRSLVRGFLAAVGSVLLAVLAYSGWEFKSVTAEIRKDRAEIAIRLSEINNLMKDIRLRAANVQRVADSADLALERANGFTELANERVRHTSHTQETFFAAQKELLSHAAGLGQQASHSAQKAADALDLIRDQNIAAKIEQAAELTRRANEAQEQANQVLSDVKNINAEIEESLDGLKTLKDVNYELVKSRTWQFFWLSKKRPQVVELPYILPEGPVEDRNYTLSFRTTGSGKNVVVEYQIRRPDQIDGAEEWHAWSVGGFWETEDQTTNLVGTPFEAMLMARYKHFFNDRLAIVIRGVADL